MRVLVACEFSGIVRDAFIRHGHDAWSVDLLPSESNPFPAPDKGPHFQGDAWQVAEDPAYGEWDLMIAHPPCTHLAVSGARWFKDRRKEQEHAIWFFKTLCNVERIPRIAVENPIGIMSTKFRKPDQIIQPWMFGHPETKATCLWLKNLPSLIPIYAKWENLRQVKGYPIYAKPRARVHYASPGPDRWKERSRTLQGIADAMADQWGIL